MLSTIVKEVELRNTQSISQVFSIASDGILGIALLGIGLSVGEAKGMV